MPLQPRPWGREESLWRTYGRPTLLGLFIVAMFAVAVVVNVDPRFDPAPHRDPSAEPLVEADRIVRDRLRDNDASFSPQFVIQTFQGPEVCGLIHTPGETYPAYFHVSATGDPTIGNFQTAEGRAGWDTQCGDRRQGGAKAWR